MTHAAIAVDDQLIAAAHDTARRLATLAEGHTVVAHHPIETALARTLAARIADDRITACPHLAAAPQPCTWTAGTDYLSCTRCLDQTAGSDERCDCCGDGSLADNGTSTIFALGPIAVLGTVCGACRLLESTDAGDLVVATREVVTALQRLWDGA
jgi:hypothetical protein